MMLMLLEENLVEKSFGHLESPRSKITKLADQCSIQEGTTFPYREHQHFQKKEKD